MTDVPQFCRIRAPRATDRADWSVMWCDYLATLERGERHGALADMPIALPHEAIFTYVLSGGPDEFRGLVAERHGRLVGFAHYRMLSRCWRREASCHLQDLYVTPMMRGMGVGDALVAAVEGIARAQGAAGLWGLAVATSEVRRDMTHFPTGPGSNGAAPAGRWQA